MSSNAKPQTNQDRRTFLAVVGQCAVGLGLSACGSSSADRAGEAASPQMPSVILPPAKVTFPLRTEAGKRYLVDAEGTPFLVHGDTAWSLVGQLNDSEIDRYLQDRQARGVTTILLNAPEPYYTSHDPPYANAEGVVPFTPMTDFARPVEAYWRRVDRVVDGAKSRGMACVINPAYLGSIGDGWLDAVNQASEASLQTYGAWLAKRYTQGNIIWCLGGDRDSSAAIAKQWNIVIGMRTVRTDDVIAGHPLADDSNADDAYTYWRSYEGFNLNTVYGWEQGGFYAYMLCAQAYTRQMPFLYFEGQYENEGKPRVDRAQLRRQSYGALLSGACGQFFGNNPIWHFESPKRPFPYPGTWESNLGSAGAVDQTFVRVLFAACAWWKLVPRADSTLVTSGLGEKAKRVYPAVADDGSFAMIYVPGAQTVSVDLSALSPQPVRARLYDPTRGTYSAVAGSPFVDRVVTPIRTDGERVIVLDAAAESPAAM